MRLQRQWDLHRVGERNGPVEDDLMRAGADGEPDNAVRILPKGIRRLAVQDDLSRSPAFGAAWEGYCGFGGGVDLHPQQERARRRFETEARARSAGRGAVGPLEEALLQ